uniref:Uncharacterized protein n=1 Tax=Anguilla anguilla TaxID=7936 RepID=A0A0E9VI74_ANGAN
MVFLFFSHDQLKIRSLCHCKTTRVWQTTYISRFTHTT